MFFCLDFEPEKNHSVSKSAGEICASRHKSASHLITLPQAIVQISSVLPRHFHPQVFQADNTRSQIVHGHVARYAESLRYSSRCVLRSYQVPVVCRSGRTEIIERGRNISGDSGFLAPLIFQVTSKTRASALKLGKRTSAYFADFWRRPATRDDFSPETKADYWRLMEGSKQMQTAIQKQRRGLKNLI